MTDTVVSLVAAAMRADSDALRTVSQNVANAESVAYRRRIPVAHTSFAELSAVNAALTAGAHASALQASAAPGGSALPSIESSTVVDMQAGTMRQTSQALHVAIDGPGFFVVGTPQGDAVTRSGDFRVDEQGVLTTANGQPVMGEQGPIVVGDVAPVIEADGTVRVRGASAGRLRIVEVSDPQQLAALGDGSFAAPAGVELIDTATARVRQGFLETSNVSAVGEVIRMMEIVRHFEATQRLARTHDDMMSKAISQLGRV